MNRFENEIQKTCEYIKSESKKINSEKNKRYYRKKISQKTIKIKEMYDKGMTATEISRKTRIPRTTVRHHIIK